MLTLLHGTLLYLLNIALKMWGMTFQRHNHVQELEGGVPRDPGEKYRAITLKLNFSISV